MKWRVDESKPKRCCKDGICPNIGTPVPEYVTCVQTLLPTTPTAEFTQNLVENEDEIDELFNLKDDLEFTRFNEEKAHDSKIGYQLPCKGDSGSAHWVKSNSGKYVMIGITAKGHWPQYNYCGEQAWMQKTTYNQKPKNILDWIKVKAKIIDSCYAQLSEGGVVVH